MLSQRDFLVSTSLLLFGCGGSDDVVIPRPANPRKDLFFGYYGCVRPQPSETADHVNLFWESFWPPDVQQSIENVLYMARDSVLDVSQFMFIRQPGSSRAVLSSNAERQLRDMFTMFQRAGALKYIKYLYPQDEPAWTLVSESIHRQGIDLLKRVSAEFPELSGVKYACIYHCESGIPVTWNIDQFDVVGYDDYAKGAETLVNGQYDSLVEKLKPGQRTLIVPGGSYLQDPEPFLAFAEGHPEVSMVIAFKWFEEDNSPGIRDNGMAEAYRNTGRIICSGEW
jgi:hypothetical protein